MIHYINGPCTRMDWPRPVLGFWQRWDDTAKFSPQALRVDCPACLMWEALTQINRVDDWRTKAVVVEAPK